eukprot:1418274-Rhodomonas_salina.1
MSVGRREEPPIAEPAQDDQGRDGKEDTEEKEGNEGEKGERRRQDSLEKKISTDKHRHQTSSSLCLPHGG